MTAVLAMVSTRVARIVWLTVGLLLAVRPAGAQPIELKVLHEFPGNDGGAQPSTLIQASDGNFYGTTRLGGSSEQGTLFRMSSAGTTTILHYFSGDDGIYPNSLVQGQNGVLYGLTSAAADGYGTIFTASLEGAVTRLFSFSTNGPVGTGPVALVAAADGHIYGATSSGGAGGSGTVFRIEGDGSVVPIHASYPEAVRTLIDGGDGNLYGVAARYDGALNLATSSVFRLNVNGALEEIYRLPSSTFYPGIGPRTLSGLARMADGTFYTLVACPGTLLKITAAGEAIPLSSFGACATTPPNLDSVVIRRAQFTSAPDGSTYGVLMYTTPFTNVIFHITPEGVLTLMHVFAQGVASLSPIVLGDNGRLYGVSDVDGNAKKGIAYSLDVSSICVRAFNAVEWFFDASGGNGAVQVTAPNSCNWVATSASANLAVVTGASGSGNGTVKFIVIPNALSSLRRDGYLTINGVQLVVHQSGCDFTFRQSPTTAGASGGIGRVTIDTANVCTWNVTDIPPWIATIAGGSGTGPGEWRYVMSANATGSIRDATIAIADRHSVFLIQLAGQVTPIVTGRTSALTLLNGDDTRWLTLEAIQGRSYCVQVAAAPTSVEPASPAVALFDGNGTPMLPTSTIPGCFRAFTTGTAVARITQSETSARAYQLRVVETTLWSNWWFIGADYASYTLLRNTTDAVVGAVLHWRSADGTSVAGTFVDVPANGVVAIDARPAVAASSFAVSGTVEVSHSGDPAALVGSQTTLSATTGLSFDTVLRQRDAR
jgi:uncharacterized repeat protein (TIGR03803 family)